MNELTNFIFFLNSKISNVMLIHVATFSQLLYSSYNSVLQ